jgi:hypothetical protein
MPETLIDPKASLLQPAFTCRRGALAPIPRHEIFL